MAKKLILPKTIIPPKMQPISPPGNKQLRLIEPFELPFIYDGKVYKLIIPAEFISDGSSLPIGLIYGKYDPDTWEAFVTHDFLYAVDILPRLLCDLLYCELLKYGKIASWKAEAAYRVLRLVGFIPYGRHRRAEHTGFEAHARKCGLEAQDGKYKCLLASAYA